ncbi:TfoX/Sxy family protein [Rhizobacter sp. OV335]|uniref:TfoX/Sxy family protein n=1 Tax=Rhizobacter sp. OV335 TaxID=1500264 RepID=UPI000918F044|nr:TfoX/Sxy family protein [Rhizobacter sp. OV335]SHN04784.1 DNA transformation protein [Rhizobacter sp. OV335]
MATISSPKDEFARYCVELLGSLGPTRSRRMFGGHGFYVDDVFIALIFEERLYLKADDATRARFEQAGCQPFVYEGGQGKSVSISYYTAPDDAMESPALMRPWARLAMEAGLRAAAAKARKPVKPRAAPAKTKRPAAKRAAR